MSTGTGIAIAGAWVMVGMIGLSPTVSGMGLTYGFILASVVTFILV